MYISPDEQYIVFVDTGNAKNTCLLLGVNFVDFYYEYNNRFGRNPFVVSAIELSDDQYYDLRDNVHSDYIFEG